MANVLLEIGTEEIPAGYLPPALAQLTDLARARLQADRIAFEELATWGTPRRITFYATGVAEHQEPAIREVRGPAAQAAFARNGEPTQAAIGFARSQGVAVSDLRIKKFDGNEYVTAVFRDEGLPTVELLPAIFQALIVGLTFPKTMRWGAGTVRFARPVRWLAALMDDVVVPFSVDGLVSGRITRGHRFLSPGDVEIPSAAEYRRVMDENHVLVVPEERREEIRRQLQSIAERDEATILDDGTLLEETTFHVEYPTAVRGNLDTRFLSLPREVLVQVLRHEQEFFPLTDADGVLLPAFLAVRNGDKAYLSTVREGYESVAGAKLIDALFFFEQDARRPLADRVEDLRGIIFQERLGSLHDKAERLQALAGAIADRLGLAPDERAAAMRAALLAKADLVTSMVVEHPELQGVMGRVYARNSGESEAVAAAIGEHYLPRAAGDPVPATAPARVVALADKMDTVAGSFAIGLIPTGSEDPYGLRRDAQGIVRILAEANYRLSLSRLITLALGELQVELAQPVEEITAALTSFLRQRVETLLAGAGFAPPVVKAALAVSADTPADAMARARVIQSHLDDPTFATVARLATRLSNITRNFPGDEIRPELLTEPAECDLYARYEEIAPRALFFAERGEFAELLKLLSTLAPAIDRFFNDILVMADDPAVRQARLALVWHLATLFRRLGDLSGLGIRE